MQSCGKTRQHRHVPPQKKTRSPDSILGVTGREVQTLPMCFGPSSPTRGQLGSKYGRVTLERDHDLRSNSSSTFFGQSVRVFFDSLSFLWTVLVYRASVIMIREHCYKVKGSNYLSPTRLLQTILRKTLDYLGHCCQNWLIIRRSRADRSTLRSFKKLE